MTFIPKAKDINWALKNKPELLWESIYLSELTELPKFIYQYSLRFSSKPSGFPEWKAITKMIASGKLLKPLTLTDSQILDLLYKFHVDVHETCEESFNVEALFSVVSIIKNHSLGDSLTGTKVISNTTFVPNFKIIFPYLIRLRC